MKTFKYLYLVDQDIEKILFDGMDYDVDADQMVLGNSTYQVSYFYIEGFKDMKNALVLTKNKDFKSGKHTVTTYEFSIDGECYLLHSLKDKGIGYAEKKKNGRHYYICLKTFLEALEKRVLIAKYQKALIEELK